MKLPSPRILVVLLALPAILLPAASLAFILWQGLPALNWRIMSGTGLSGFGLEHGLFGQIAGSLMLMLGAAWLAAPVSLALSLYAQLYAGARLERHIVTALHLLQGIPPIVYGLFGLVLFVHLLHWGISLLAGMIVLAVIMLPVMTLNALHALQRIPVEYSESARALGLDDATLIRRVWLPAAWPAMLTGLLLGMARALSETAPILFVATVFSGVRWPDSPLQPVTTLQTHIFYLAQEGADARVVGIAWGAACLLIGLVLLCSMAALLLRRLQYRRGITA